MSEVKTHAATSQGLLSAAPAAPEFTALWRNVSKFAHGKTPENRKAKPASGNASPRFTDLQSPKRRGRFPGVNADSPGDVEPSQDIIWDSTSPTQANSGFRCTKVEISDLVNRIAPKDVKPLRTDSTLLQWIGDSAVPCTPDVPKQRIRKRSSRQNSVDDLMKLARQFDENMQQDKEIFNKNINKCVNSDDPEQTESIAPQNESLLCDPEEAALHALFDSSTQKVSGRLSQGSTASTCSQEVTRPPAMSSSHKPTETNKCDDFEDDWENDELLNDSLLLAITQNPEQHSATTKTSMQSNTKCISDVKPFGNTNNGPKVSGVHPKPSCSTLQALCPKLKTTNRSTFKLGPNPVVLSSTWLPKEPHESRFTALKSSDKAEQKSVVSANDDNLWDNDDDDALLYQVCDSVERISNSQPHKVNQSDRQQKNTAPLPINPTNPSANKQSCVFVRSNSLPVTSSDTQNYQGWNNPMNGSSTKPQSLPESDASMGSFNQKKPCSEGFQHFFHNRNMDKSLQKSNHTAFKRNVSDSAVICNKVFVTSQITGKCSAAEIEKKKQEALARRRQRMQNSQKP